MTNQNSIHILICTLHCITTVCRLQTKAVNTRIFHHPVPDLYYLVFTRYPNFLFLLKKFKKIYHKMQCIVIIYIIACFVCNHAFSLFHIQWSVFRCAVAAVKDKIMKSFSNIKNKSKCPMSFGN